MGDFISYKGLPKSVRCEDPQHPSVAAQELRSFLRDIDPERRRAGRLTKAEVKKYYPGANWSSLKSNAAKLLKEWKRWKQLCSGSKAKSSTCRCGGRATSSITAWKKKILPVQDKTSSKNKDALWGLHAKYSVQKHRFEIEFGYSCSPAWCTVSLELEFKRLQPIKSVQLSVSGKVVTIRIVHYSGKKTHLKARLHKSSRDDKSKVRYRFMKNGDPTKAKVVHGGLTTSTLIEDPENDLDD